eukprot:4311058-Amphidinium_carterae.1
MYEYFHNENDISEVRSLHEGVLYSEYWMSLDDIKDLERRAYSNEEPALQEYKWYLEGNRKLERDLREEYEKYHGVLEDGDDYQQALQDKDRQALKTIIYEYAAKVRERKLLWRKQKIAENDKKKEAWKKEILREQAEKAEEEEKQRTKRTRDEAASASAASAAPAAQEEKNYDKENPPRPTRLAPLPTYERPETTAKSGELQE